MQDDVDAVYELPWHRRTGCYYAYLTLLCLALAALGAVAGSRAACVTMLAGAAFLGLSALHHARWEPYRVVLSGEGVTFVAGAGPTAVRWQDVMIVALLPGRFGGTLAWMLGDGESVTMPGGVGNVHRLLAAVEARAPHVDVRS